MFDDVFVAWNVFKGFSVVFMRFENLIPIPLTARDVNGVDRQHYLTSNIIGSNPLFTQATTISDITKASYLQFRTPFLLLLKYCEKSFNSTD